MHQRLKEIIFKKLNKDLSKVEIILSENQSIWFIDRANKYWYFEFEKSGKLWWRYEFFTDFFPLFCLEIDKFQPLLSEWVEGVLNCGVSTTGDWSADRLVSVKNILNRGVSETRNTGDRSPEMVEGVLNCRVSSMETMRWEALIPVEGVLNHGYRKGSRKVDEVLNHEVDTNTEGRYNKPRQVDKVLNREINEIDGGELLDNTTVEKVLNHKVVSILPANLQNDFVQQVLVNELIYEVESADPLDTPASDSVDEVLRYKVTGTIPDLNESLADVEIILNSIVPPEIP